MQLRRATTEDAAAIAALHADSWRRHYRGIYSDRYLEEEADAERLGVWSERLAASNAFTATTLALDGDDLLGFVHVVLDADPDHGALLDNLHVRHDQQGTGIGRQLMAAAAGYTAAERPGQGLFLWVLEDNTRAQGFYLRCGGTLADRATSEAPGGGPVTAIRVVWPDPTALLA